MIEKLFEHKYQPYNLTVHYIQSQIRNQYVTFSFNKESFAMKLVADLTVPKGLFCPSPSVYYERRSVNFLWCLAHELSSRDVGGKKHIIPAKLLLLSFGKLS